MNYLIEDIAVYFLELWQNASLTDYAGLVLAMILFSWFISRYGRKLGT
jgi:hypothetical protein